MAMAPSRLQATCGGSVEGTYVDKSGDCTCQELLDPTQALLVSGVWILGLIWPPWRSSPHFPPAGGTLGGERKERLRR